MPSSVNGGYKRAGDIEEGEQRGTRRTCSWHSIINSVVISLLVVLVITTTFYNPVREKESGQQAAAQIPRTEKVQAQNSESSEKITAQTPCSEQMPDSAQTPDSAQMPDSAQTPGSAQKECENGGSVNEEEMKIYEKDKKGGENSEMEQEEETVNVMEHVTELSKSAARKEDVENMEVQTSTYSHTSTTTPPAPASYRIRLDECQDIAVKKGEMLECRDTLTAHTHELMVTVGVQLNAKGVVVELKCCKITIELENTA